MKLKYSSILLISVVSLWMLVSCSFFPKKGGVSTFPHEISGVRFDKDHFSFGEMIFGEEKTATLILYNPTTKTMEPEFRFSEDWIRVIQTKRYIEPGDTVKVYVRLVSGNCEKYGSCVQRMVFIPDRARGECQQPFLITAEIMEDFTRMTPEEKSMAPKISWDMTEFDFGDVQQEQKAVHFFKLKNRGKRDLIIRRVETTCGCTAVMPESRVVRAGDSTRLKVVFHTAGREGKQLKTIRVTSNDFSQPNTILKIRANVVCKQ